MVAAQSVPQVDDATLEYGSSGGDWVSYNLNWKEQRYSTLTQINGDNVDRLGLAWSYDIPAATGDPQNRQEATHLVHDGVLYSIAPWSIVYAVDARTGEEIWHVDPEVDQALWGPRICCGVVNRGIALYEGKVIAPVVDGRLRALDTETGAVLWDTRVSPDDEPYTITMAPRVIAGGRVIIGVSGGEYGVRGFFDAYDADTGALVWRFYTVPGRPEDGFENAAMEMAAATWDESFWELGIYGGAPVWNGMAYDAEADLVYVGTGQPAPWSSAIRGSGDALFTSSIVAVRGATGRYVWHYQPTPGDDWDYDSIADIMLVDVEIDGRRRKTLMHAPKNGFFYVLDRHTGELISAEPWVTVSWAAGINMQTGRPLVNPEARYGTASVSVLPWMGGGHVWPPWSYSPQTGLVYIPSTIGQAANLAAAEEFEVNPGGLNMGISFGGRGGGRGGRGGDAPAGLDPDNPEVAGALAGPPPPPVIDPPAIGPRRRESGNILSAWDPVGQREAWRAENASSGFNQGGTLATAGNLVFTVANGSMLRVYRADTGENLLDLPLGLTSAGPPMTFTQDGVQYIAVAGGPATQGGGRGGRGDNAGPPEPSRLLALALDGTTPLPGVPEPEEDPAEDDDN
jgi:PQQ-dependent dehydrogenase (methanol/ethanol family)